MRNSGLHPTMTARYDGLTLFRLGGGIELAHLANAFEDVIEHHPMLRAVLEPARKGYRQRVFPVGANKHFTLDIDPAADLDELRQRLIAQRHTIDKVCQGLPLFRATIHDFGSSLYLSVCLHHLLSDAWTMELLWRDLAECYAARLDRRPAQLPSSPVSYLDYVRDQREVSAKKLDATVDFHRRVLGSEDSTVRWPDPAVAYEGGPTDVDFADVVITAENTKPITAISRSARVSPFVVLMCATAAAITRVTGQGHPIIGVDTANREDPRWHEMVGFVVNTRLVRVPVARHSDLVELVRKVRAAWMESDGYADVYYDQVLKALGDPQIVKVNMPNLSTRLDVEELALQGAHVDQLPIEISVNTWRDIAVFWYLDGRGYRARIYHRLQAVDALTAVLLCSEIHDVLDSGRISRSARPRDMSTIGGAG